MRHPRNHEPAKQHGEHDDLHDVEITDGMFVKPPQHRVERQRAQEEGTEEEHEKAHEAKRRHRAERLRLHDEKMAAIKTRHEEAVSAGAVFTNAAARIYWRMDGPLFCHFFLFGSPTQRERERGAGGGGGGAGGPPMKTPQNKKHSGRSSNGNNNNNNNNNNKDQCQ